jgi:hypothetical protein
MVKENARMYGFMRETGREWSMARIGKGFEAED